MRAKWITVGLTVFSAVFGLMMASGSSAYADRWSHTDKRGDVAKLKFTRHDFAVVAAPRDVTTDITRLTVNHRAHRVVLRLQVRDLRRADSRGVVAIVKTPTERHFVIVQSSEFAFVGKQGPGRCAGLRKTFDYTANVVTIGIPRHCLGKPDWVRVGIQMSTTADTFANGDSEHFDDALRNRSTSFDERPTFSPQGPPMMVRTTAAALLVVALVGVSSPAMAEKSAVRDSVGDVFRVSGGNEGPAPDNSTADVVKSVTTHSAKRVKIKLRFVDLASGTAKAGVVVDIKTNKVNYELSPKKVQFLGSGFVLRDFKGNKIKCTGMKKKVSAAKRRHQDLGSPALLWDHLAGSASVLGPSVSSNQTSSSMTPYIRRPAQERQPDVRAQVAPRLNPSQPLAGASDTS